MSHPLDDLMDSWMEMMDGMQRPRRMIRPTERPTSIGDWEDRNGDIAVTLDMPGIEKKDIELTVDKHMVRVKAKTDDRDYSFSKEMTMELNPDEVKANFNNGVLDITIQKAEESKGKNIAIE
jgi:HSP20 family protein